MPLLTATNTFAIRIRQKALEFSSTVLSTPSLYCTLQYKLLFNKIVSSKGTVLLSLLFIECVCVSLFSHSLCTASFQQCGQNLACGKIVTKGLCRGTTRCVKHGLERDPARSMHYKINLKKHNIKCSRLAFAQMPQPMHSSSDINAILSAGATSIHSFPAKYDIFLNIFNYT